MSVVIFCRKNHPVQITKLRRCLENLLKYSGMGEATLEVSLVGEKRIRDLNRQYLGRDRITDVISFPMDPKPPFKGVPWHLGEIFLATPVARRQAAKARRSLTAQVIRLGVHGVIHLQGLDHERSTKARKDFEALEGRYLNYLKKKGWFSWDGSLQF